MTYWSNLIRESSAKSIVSYTLTLSDIKREKTRQMKIETIPVSMYEAHYKSDTCLAKMVEVRAKPASRMMTDSRQATCTHHS